MDIEDAIQAVLNLTEGDRDRFLELAEERWVGLWLSLPSNALPGTQGHVTAVLQAAWDYACGVDEDQSEGWLEGQF